MIAAIKLENNLDCKILCQKIQDLINWHNKYEQIDSDSILVIRIQPIIDSKTGQRAIEHKK